MRFVFLFFMFFASTAFAQSSDPEINLEGLDEQQVAALMTTAAEMRAAEVVAEPARQYSEYAELGRRIAVAVVEVADELGETPETVLQSYVGRMTLGLVFYKVIGEELLSLVFGIGWLCIFLPSWWYFFHRLILKERPIIERFDEEHNLIEKQVMEYDSLSSGTKEYLLWMRWCMFGILVIGLTFSVFIL